MRILTHSETQKLAYLSNYGVELALIEPTATGLRKSIMDATKPVRDYFAKENIHDYDTQVQGPENKHLVRTRIFDRSDQHDTMTSLYRPLTKMGDPRIWVYGINRHCSPNDILALVAHNNTLKVFNLTRYDVVLHGERSGPFRDFLLSYARAAESTANELLAKIRSVASKGYIKSDLDADTAVGRLLETALGIPANSSRQPDYKGIEIKSYRSERTNRKNLFAQVPDWQLSKFKSSKAILDAFGYDRSGVKKLYCTVSTTASNSQGLRLVVDDDRGYLGELSNDNSVGEFVIWPMQKLRDRLAEKHAETFWVEADEKRIGNDVYFKYTKIEHTRGPLTTQLDILLKNGTITVDHLIKERGSSVVEKGPLFKIDRKGLPLLFPPSKTYEL